MKDDLLGYLTAEGFVDIRYWENDNGIYDGRIASIKEYEPIYLELEDGSKRLMWRNNEAVYTYETNRLFFKRYGKMCNNANEALLQSNEWVREMKSLHQVYK
jgi:hypothetical protein